jgi:hypothetical protein
LKGFEMKTCEALVVKEYKGGRAKTKRPYGTKGNDLPLCGGTIRFTTDIIGGCSGGHGPDDYCYCGQPEVSINATCSRCTAAYFDGIDHLLAGGLDLFTRLLNEQEAI